MLWNEFRFGRKINIERINRIIFWTMSGNLYSSPIPVQKYWTDWLLQIPRSFSFFRCCSVNYAGIRGCQPPKSGGCINQHVLGGSSFSEQPLLRGYNLPIPIKKAEFPRKWWFSRFWEVNNLSTSELVSINASALKYCAHIRKLKVPVSETFSCSI